MPRPVLYAHAVPGISSRRARRSCRFCTTSECVCAANNRPVYNTQSKAKNMCVHNKLSKPAASTRRRRRRCHVVVDVFLHAYMSLSVHVTGCVVRSTASNPKRKGTLLGWAIARMRAALGQVKSSSGDLGAASVEPFRSFAAAPHAPRPPTRYATPPCIRDPRQPPKASHGTF